MEDTQYTQYYVAFLDILGFKEQVTRDPCEEILKMYEFLGNMSEIYFGEGNEERKNNIKVKIMSDSICIYIKANIPNALDELVKFCVVFQSNLLIREPCTFVRGGITCGDMYAKDDIMFGPALTEAYLLEEKNAKVPRIIMCKNILDYGKSGMDEETRTALDLYLFRDDDAFYALNYFALLCVGDYGKTIERVNTTISNWLDTTVNESIRQKYLYVEKHFQKYLKVKNNA